MTFTSFLLDAALLLLAYFGSYWLALHVFVLIQASSRRPAPTPAASQDRGSVLVLVPSHHEGAALADTVRSLVDQDYEGEIAIEVLVADFTDSSVEAIRGAFEPIDESDDRLVLDAGLARRQVSVIAVGQSAKPAKLNHALAHATADFIALLDADHRAHPEWISTAVSVFAQSDVAVVQSRKRPLSTSTLAQIWDASLSHVAFELFNRACQRSFDAVSFTGSTAVFRGEVLTQYRFADCITEDTYLSFDLLLDKHRIIYDPRVGSYEEATATIPSFVFRRRRWSAGHTHAFFAHLLPLLRSRAPLSTRIQVFILGQFFLVPFVIALFFAVQGLYYFAIFTVEVRAAVLLVSAALALVLTVWLSWARSTKLSDLLVCWAVLVPHVSMSGALFYLFFAEETFYFITSFPYQGQLWGAQLVIILAGIVTFVVAWLSLRSIGVRHAIAFVLTTPLVIFFDLLSSLFGLSDFVLGRREWSKIARRHEVSDSVDAGLRARLVETTRTVRRRWIYGLYLAPVVALVVVVTNDVLSVGPCGDPQPLLWDPILISVPEHPILEVRLDKSADGDRLRVRVRSTIRPKEPGPLDLRVFEGRRQVARQRLEIPRDDPGHEVELDWPLGWATRRVGVSLSGRGLQCLVDRDVPTHVIEARPGGMHVNGEPFLIKGIVPTFSAPGVGLGLDVGYAQLKSVGVNTARLYHRPTQAILAAARRHHMLLIPQPDRSTWDSLNPESFFDRALYRRRWRGLVQESEGAPFVLMLNTGNELEIDDRSPQMLDAIRRMLSQAATTNVGGLTTYSTFATFVDYPVDVLGINMLDSGPTYWGPALDLVDAMGRPYYASEFGGFVAFFEAPSPLLRQWRMWRQSEALDRRGALGSVFFASHDNWSQAVPPGGYNDPFNGNHPDDRRGYWDPANRPKPELAMLAFLLADLEAEIVDELVEPATEEVRLRVGNRRRYSLQEVSMNLGDDGSWSLGDFEPGASRELTLPVAALRAAPGYPDVTVSFAHRSHHGLRGQSRWTMPVPDPARGPVLLGAPTFATERTAEGITFTSLRAGTAEVVVPSAWPSVSFDGRVLPNRHSRIPVPLPASAHPVEDLEMSSDGSRWRPFAGARIGTGDRFLRFRLPAVQAPKRTLVLAGLAATRVHIRWEEGTASYPAHPYRETPIDVTNREGTVTLRMRRTRARYLSARNSPTGEAVPIELAPPFVFAPRRVEVSRGSR